MPQLNCVFLFLKKQPHNLITLVKEMNCAVLSGEDHCCRLCGLSTEIKLSLPYLKPQRQIKNYLATWIKTSLLWHSFKHSDVFSSVKNVSSPIGLDLFQQNTAMIYISFEALQTKQSARIQPESVPPFPDPPTGSRHWEKILLGWAEVEICSWISPALW